MSVTVRRSIDAPAVLQSAFLEWDAGNVLTAEGIPDDDSWYEIPDARVPYSSPDLAAIVALRFTIYARCWQVGNLVDFRVRRFNTGAADYDKTLPVSGMLENLFVPASVQPFALEFLDVRDDPAVTDYEYRLEARVRPDLTSANAGILLVHGGFAELREHSAGLELQWITVYLTATGKIERVAMARAGEQSTWLRTGRNYLVGRGDPRTQYVSGGALTARPSSTLSIDTQNVTVGGTVTITGQSMPKRVSILGPAQDVFQDADPVVTLQFRAPGIYNVQAEQFPELPASWAVTVTV